MIYSISIQGTHLYFSRKLCTQINCNSSGWHNFPNILESVMALRLYISGLNQAIRQYIETIWVVTMKGVLPVPSERGLAMLLSNAQNKTIQSKRLIVLRFRNPALCHFPPYLVTWVVSTPYK